MKKSIEREQDAKYDYNMAHNITFRVVADDKVFPPTHDEVQAHSDYEARSGAGRLVDHHEVRLEKVVNEKVYVVASCIRDLNP